MPRTTTSKKGKVQTTFQPRTSPIRPFRAGLLMAISVLFGLALIDYDPHQEGLISAFAISTDTATSPNMVGTFGRDAAFVLLYTLGLGTWFLLFSLFWVGFLNLIRKSHLITVPRYVVLLIATCAASGLGNAALTLSWFSHVQDFFSVDYFPKGPGGVVGHYINEAFLYDKLGAVGSLLILFSALLAGAAALFSDPSKNLFERTFQRWADRREENKLTKEERRKRAKERAAAKEERLRLREEMRLEKDKARAERMTRKREKREAALALKREKEEAKAKKIAESADSTIEDIDEPSSLESNHIVDSELLAGAIPVKKRRSAAVRRRPAVLVEDELSSETNDGDEASEIKTVESKTTPVKGVESNEEVDSGFKIVAGEKVEKAKPLFPARKGNYKFPTMDLLQEPGLPEDHVPENHKETALALKNTLDEFGVKVELGEVHTGPVITRYEVYPAPGVRVEKIANLAKNIGMSLKAQSVRILAPVPGKGCVGVEVPNRFPLPVCIREIIESRAWVDSRAEIPVVLGKEVSGKPLVADLTKMPHLLIAGSTGSGKTVCINSVIASLLYHASPDDLRFIMIDPKIVEMQIYNSLPHMLIPVVTDPKKVPGALKWLISEMERRYHVFARAKVRNIAGFNSKILKDKEERKRAEEMEADMSAEERAALAEANDSEEEGEEGFELPKEKMPYIVCIVDELADLMMVAPADIETGIARLAQLARAAGIHLILATQRPSVNVITGVIKANLPSRIAFKVASKIDSRTILDEGGADALIGKGDMLFIPPGAHTLVRAQGAFVSDEEINGVVDYLKVNGPPNILEQVQAQIEAGDEEGAAIEGDFEDDLVPKAIEVIRSSKRASTSMLQRRLRIGYNRAARIMEILEDEGYVGPENGAQPREILKDLD